MRRDVALILLYDDEKKVLLQHRTDDAPRLPGFWAFFGGGIEKEESPENAVLRETLEELSYYLKSPKLVLVQEFESAGINGNKYVFMEKYDSNKKLVQKEGQGMDWFLPDSTKNLKMTDDDRIVLKLIQGKY